MENELSLVNQVRFSVVSRKIKVLGFAIMAGLLAIFFTGLLISGNNVNKDLAILNLVALIVCPLFCISSVYMKKMLLRGVTDDNFSNKYFTAHIVAFAMCDAGGLFCISTNLFVNENLIYASFGMLITLVYLWINMPKEEDFNTLHLGRPDITP